LRRRCSTFSSVLRGAARCALVPATLLALSAPRATATSFALAPDQKLVGAPGVYVTREEDTLGDVARINDLGYGQLAVVNEGVDPWFPGRGHRVTLPALYLVPEGARTGIVVNLAEQRLYYFPPGGHTVETYPLGVGVEGRSTPTGVTRILRKDARPTWYPPPSIREEKPELPTVVPLGPDNPLGDYALRLGWPGYLIHGTNKPYGVGRNVSHGCLRLYPEDVARLFREVTIGTPVRVIDQEIRLAWVGEELYLAVAPSKEQMDELALNRPMSPAIPPDLVRRVVDAAGPQVDRVDWGAVERIGIKRPGMPIRITNPALSATIE
jgi:L,D-transpeptidase ErfK/SrfK